MADPWNQLLDWAQKHPDETLKLVFGLAGTLLAVLLKDLLFPLCKFILNALGLLAVAMFSGFTVFDRFFTLPRYLRRLEEKVSRLTNPWLTERQQLKDIFVPVSASGASGSGERIELGRLLQEAYRIVLIGDPGSGKSTGLRALARRCVLRELLTKQGRTLVPILVELRRWASSKDTLDQFITADLKALGFPRSSRLIGQLERRGRIIYLFDGLDEVDESDRPRILDEVRRLLERQAAEQLCHVLLTSRPVGYDGQLGDVVDREVRMAEFNPADIRKFIGNWDFRPPKSQERLVQAISARRPILEICRNPLMLTIVTSLYKETEYQLPDSREAFYRTCIDALLRKWDAVRLLEERNKINPDQKEAFLQEFAFEALKEGTLDFHDTALLAKIEAFLERRKYTGVDAGRFKFELMRSGLLAALPTGELFFAHKTLAESLAAFHLRGKSDTLNELWARKPDVWLEVCSLVVADPRTDEKDIAGLLRTAQVAQNWTGLLTLAGEAHLCPPPQRKEIVEELLLRQALWPGYDQRAVSGIARLGADTHAIFGEMMGHGDLQVRIRAIYALGLLLHENWASEMIVSSLRDRSTRTAAISAIAGMAEDAIPVVRRLLHTQPHYEVALACIHTLKAVSGLPAVETLLPLLAHEEEPVRSEAAFAAGQILADPDMRTAFEGSSAPGVPAIPDTETRETMYWAVPWVDEGKTAHRTIYGLIIQQLAQTLRNADISSLEQAVTVGARFLIPALIKVGRSARAKIVENIQGIDEEPSKIQRPVPGRLLVLCLEIQRLSKPENIWMRARDVHQKDIALEGERALWTLGALFSLVVIAPIIVAIVTHAMSPWSLSIEATVLALATWVAINDEDIKSGFFFMVLTHGYATMGFRLSIDELSRRDRRHKAINTCLACAATALIVINIYSVYQLRGWWWICAVPFVLTITCKLEVDDTVSVWRRSNPLATARDSLESEQWQIGRKSILSNR